ncbi:MAG TPA: nuclear transport factor 2 family protein [Candidatus Aquilonibacter sp.]|nr:nuclear transport factor 2 family protein [Candidatus Aquilonibacter sp.]
MPEAESRNEQLVKTFFDTLSTGDLERVRPLLHEQATWTPMGTGIPGAEGAKGRDAIIDDLLVPVRGLFVEGDPKVKMSTILSKGPLVACETQGTGLLRNGKQYNNRYAWMIEIKDDKIFALREYMDTYHISTLV